MTDESETSSSSSDAQPPTDDADPPADADTVDAGPVISPETKIVDVGNANRPPASGGSASNSEAGERPPSAEVTTHAPTADETSSDTDADAGTETASDAAAEVTIGDASREADRKIEAAEGASYSEAITTVREDLREDVLSLSEQITEVENRRDRYERERDQYADTRDVLADAVDEGRFDDERFRLELKGGLSKQVRPEDAADLLDQFDARVDEYNQRIEDTTRQAEKLERAREKAALTHRLVVQRDQALTTLGQLPDLVGDPDLSLPDLRQLVDSMLEQAAPSGPRQSAALSPEPDSRPPSEDN